MGFGAAARTPKTPAMALIGLISQNHKRGAARLARIEADGALLEGTNLDGKLADIVQALGPVPWGVKAAGEMDVERVKALTEKGCDFLVASPENVTVEAVKEDKPAFLLSLPAGAGDGFLRAIEDLPVDAVFLSLCPGGSSLTLQDLITVGAARSMFDKYLIVGAPATVSPSELAGLRDMGVDAVAVDAGRSPEKALKAIKESLLDLPRQRKARSERGGSALSGRVGGSTPYSDEDDDEYRL